MAKPLFRGSFEKAQDYVRKLNVVFIKIHNALELYLFEVYCSMELDTSEWNTFETY